MVVAVVTLVVCCCSVAGAYTTLVQWNPVILGVSPESSKRHQDVRVIILGLQCRKNIEKEKRLSTSYLGLLIILDF